MTYLLTDLQDSDIFANLIDGRFTIGSGDGDAIYMPDTVGAIPEHLKLVFYDGVLTLLTAGAPIWVNSIPVAAFPFDVTPGDVISLSPDCHMAFTEEGNELPLIPIIEAEKDEVLFASVDKKSMIRYITIAVVGALGALAIVIGASFLGGKPPPAIEIDSDVSHMISQEQVESYLQESFGKSILQVDFTKDECLIWLDDDATANHESAKERIDAILSKMEEPRKARIQILDLKKLTADMMAKFRAKGLAVNAADGIITVSGIVPAKLVGDLNAQIEEANNQFFGFRAIVADVRADDRYNIKLVSTVIGAKEVSATMRYKDTWTIVPEGGKVFGIGTLKAVRPSSIVVSTAYGDMTYGI